MRKTNSQYGTFLRGNAFLEWVPLFLNGNFGNGFPLPFGRSGVVVFWSHSSDSDPSRLILEKTVRVGSGLLDVLRERLDLCLLPCSPLKFGVLDLECCDSSWMFELLLEHPLKLRRAFTSFSLSCWDDKKKNASKNKDDKKKIDGESVTVVWKKVEIVSPQVKKDDKKSDEKSPEKKSDDKKAGAKKSDEKGNNGGDGEKKKDSDKDKKKDEVKADASKSVEVVNKLEYYGQNPFAYSMPMYNQSYYNQDYGISTSNHGYENMGYANHGYAMQYSNGPPPPPPMYMHDSRGLDTGMFSDENPNAACSIM
ncbi:hypothetical protein Tco_0532743 [Tanacetum coccineum]